MHQGKRYRMPVDGFALVRGATQPVSSKQEAEKVWEPKFIGEIVAGKDPRKAPAPPVPEGTTVSNFLDQYFERYVVAESLRSVASIRSRVGEMLKIQNHHVLRDTHQIVIPAEHAKDSESRRIPFEPKGRLAQLLKRRRFLGPKAFVFGTATGEYQATIRTAWDSLVLLAH